MIGYMLNFKERHMEDEFLQLDSRLQGIVYMYATWMRFAYKSVVWPTTITDVFRKSDTSVHGDFRGCDVRTRGIDTGAVAAAVAFINSITVYDPQRPEMKCAVYKLTGKEAEKYGAHEDHVHFQVHPNTTFVVKEA